VQRILWDECNDEAAALARESELLLALRPRFNTIGVFAAPGQFLGWRFDGEGLAFGLSSSVADWPKRIGPWSRLRPVYRALLRLVWRALHRGAPWHAMPRSFALGPSPAGWTFCAGPGATDLLGAVAQGFEAYAEIGREDFPRWLLAAAPVTSSFEEQWAAEDAATLVEFGGRLLGGK
jgi:hypothetical protein